MDQNNTIVGADLGTNHWNEPPRGAIYRGENGMWHRARLSAPGARWSAVAQRVFFFGKNPRTRPGRDPVEGESSKALLWVDKSLGASLIGVGSKRDCCGRLK